MDAYSRTPSIWRMVPLGLYVLFLLALNPFGFWFLDWTINQGWFRWQESINVILVGGIFGQGCFAALLGGLFGRSWLDGFLVALGLAITSFLLTTLSFYLFMDETIEDIAIMLAMFPTIVLAAITPLLVCRHWLGWRFTLRGPPTRPYEPNRTEDLLGATAIVATTLMAARVPQLYWEVQPTIFWSGVAVGWCIVVAVSAIAIVPGAYFAFRVRKPLFSWLGLIGLSVLSPVGTLIVALIISYADGTSLVLMDIGPIVGACATAATVGLLGVVALHISKVRLQVFAPRSSANVEIQQAGQHSQQSNALQVRHRLMTASVIAAGMVVSAAIGSLLNARATIDAKHKSLREQLATHGGNLIVDNREIRELTVGPAATTDSLDLYVDVGPFRKLSLANSRITDDGLAKLVNLHEFTELDLSSTNITDAGLVHLRKLPLTHLSLANTRVTLTGIQSLESMATLTSLDISQLEITDTEIAAVNVAKYHSLALRDNRLTNAGVKDVCNRMEGGTVGLYERALDVGGMPIDGTTIEATLHELRLDRTEISDVVLQQRATPLYVEKLSLKNTRITDRGVKHIATAFSLQRLTLGGPNFTDAGLNKLGTGWFHALRLPCPNVDGSCFETWVPNAYFLDLSESGLRDENVAHLKQITNLRFLNLDDTSITDAALVHLQNIDHLTELSIKRTDITASGIVAASLQSHLKLHVAYGQFSDRELTRMRRNLTVIVNAKFPAEDW